MTALYPIPRTNEARYNEARLYCLSGSKAVICDFPFTATLEMLKLKH